MKRSVLVVKNLRVCLPRKMSLRSSAARVPRVDLRYLNSRIPRAHSSPLYCAATVPTAIPLKPIPPVAKRMLRATLSTLTRMSVIIGETLSCMPMNQPFTAIMLSVAGAAHILMKKYLRASSPTCGEQSSTRKAPLMKIHWIAIRKTEQARAMPNALERIFAHSFLSLCPNAWAVSPPVPGLRKAKFQ